MDTTKSVESDLAFVINVHERLVRDFPLTPYNMWCRKVHESSEKPRQKWANILSWTINPEEYTNPTLFAADYQLYCLLSKFSLGGEKDDSGKTTAYRKFLESEERCLAVNDMLTTRLRPSGVNQLLEYTKKIVADCLRPVEEYFEWLGKTLNSEAAAPRLLFSLADYERGYQELPPGMKFGPGVSVSAEGVSLKSVVEKLELGTVTPGCWALFGSALRKLRLPRPTLVKGSRLTFVPKKVGEMRSICFEPSVNMLMQKTVGVFIRRRLKAYFKINTRDQSRNKALARLGSLCNSWATIDLSSASDLIATRLVQELLPPRWYEVLFALRSPGYFDPDTSEFTLLEKFSSMGNGFTFELETLIFAAISLAAIRIWGEPHYRRDQVVCYGDDICVPAVHYNVVCQGLAVIGHIPNRSKSFAAGPFRESCGGDYFNGWDVTPLRIKEISLENPRTVINLHNRLFALSERGLHPGLTGLWCERARLFVEHWLNSHYPRVSGGKAEKLFDRSNGCYSLVSSDQWIWGSNRNSASAWHGEDSIFVPRWICVERLKVVVEYHVPQTSVNWLMALHGGATTLSEKSVVFVRNPAAVPLRVTKRKRLASARCSNTVNRAGLNVESGVETHSRCH